jgi:hypothetical protein
MTQDHRNRRAVAWSAALLLAAGGLASCGGSSTKTSARTGTNASGTVTSGETGGARGTTDPSSPTTSKRTLPVTRASSFASCMRRHGVNVPPPTTSAGGATLDFKHVDLGSSGYRSAVRACANRLLGLARVSAGNVHGAHVHGIRLTDIHISGIHLKSSGIHLKGSRLKQIRIGQVELPASKLPNIHIGNIKVPPIHATTPPVHVETPGPNLGGKENGNEPPTSTQGSTG